MNSCFIRHAPAELLPRVKTLIDQITKTSKVEFARLESEFSTAYNRFKEATNRYELALNSLRWYDYLFFTAKYSAFIEALADISRPCKIEIELDKKLKAIRKFERRTKKTLEELNTIALLCEENKVEIFVPAKTMILIKTLENTQ